MKDTMPSGLKLTFLFSTVGRLGLALSSMAVPALVASLSGLPGKDLPVYQQAGAAVFGYSIASFLAARAASWEQVRIPLIAVLSFSILSALGAFYYVILQGVATPYLILVLVVSIILAGVLLYYWLEYGQMQGGLNR